MAQAIIEEAPQSNKVWCGYCDRDNPKGEKCRHRKVVASVASKFVAESCVEIILLSNTPLQKKSDRKFCRYNLAEREGFEPPVQLPVHRISSAARSTTPAPFL